MKKLILSVLLGLSLVGCSTTNLEQKFSQYYNLGTFKGIEVYAWKSNNDWYTGLMSGTNRNKTPEEINALKPATLAEMKIIISTYDITPDELIVLVVEYPVSTNYVVINDLDNPSVKMIRQALIGYVSVLQ